MFRQFNVHSALERGIADLGFTTPTPIQQAAIPAILTGGDVMGSAMTGTGKTAAFLIPIIDRLLQTKDATTRVLVLAPTRELAAQIHAHFRALAVHTRLRSAIVVGGMPMAPQRDAFRSNVDVLIATPGRLLDHLQYPYARFPRIEVLVLDEADRMLDMGFLPAIRRVLAALPRRRQTLLFSATLPPPIVALARELLVEPTRIDVERTVAPASGVTHAVYDVDQERKPALLLALLREEPIRNALVFTRTKHRADRLVRHLQRSGVAATVIHGGRSQPQRTRALAGFKAREFRVLVATDIAARGIDIDELSHVVNFDVPALAEDYIHRIGRTGRASATGDAITFSAPAERATLRSIEHAIGRPLPRKAIPAGAGDSDALGGRSSAPPAAARAHDDGPHAHVDHRPHRTRDHRPHGTREHRPRGTRDHRRTARVSTGRTGRATTAARDA